MTLPDTAQRTLVPVLQAGLLIGWRAPGLSELGVAHLFTSRHGDEARGADEVVHLRQVHGAEVFIAEQGVPRERPAADAAVTSRLGTRLFVQVADCVPVLLASAGGAHVGAAHAGWRGLVAGVLLRTVERLGAGVTAAAIGPCLSRARFEVGPEVAEAFVRANLAEVVHAAPGSKAHIDLRAAARMQLARAGVATIDVSDRCTYDDALLHSYRRDVTHGGAPRTGRQGAWIEPARAR